MHLALKEQHMSSYFLCSVNFYLAPHFRFQDFAIEYDTSEDVQDVHAEIPIVAQGDLNLRLDHAFVTLQSVQAKRVKHYHLTHQDEVTHTHTYTHTHTHTHIHTYTRSESTLLLVDVDSDVDKRWFGGILLGWRV